MATTARQAKQEAAAAARSPVAKGVVRVGWAAKGVVYLALAWLVLELARGQSSEQADSQGALQQLASTGPGGLALLLVALGLLAYAVGRLLEATALAEASLGARDRAEAVFFFLLYGALAVSAFVLLVRGSRESGGGDQQEQQGTAFLLGLPFGRLLVGALGLGVMAAGTYAAVQGLRCRFLPTLRTGDMGPRLAELARHLGRVAYVVKGAVFVLLGGFLVQSAVTFDAGDAKGLDGTLREVADAPWGSGLLVLVSLGLLAYGAFCLLEARYRRIGSSASGLA